MNIREHTLKSIRDGMPARFAVEGGAAGVQFLADDQEFIEFDDLGYATDLGYYRLSAFPHVQSDCTNENPETIHRHEALGNDVDMFVWMDGDGYPHMLGELHQVADLYRALHSFLFDGALHPEPIDEFDPAWGQSYDIADAVAEAIAAGYAEDTDVRQTADTIRAAARRGSIRGARQIGSKWMLPKLTFRHWLLRSRGETRGRPKKNT